MTSTKPFEACFRTVPAAADWFRPEEFFLDRMAVQEPENASPAALAVGGAETFTENGLTPILPITPKLLACFTPEALAERLTLAMDGSAIQLTFRYPVRTAGGVEEHTFEKVYDGSTSLLLLEGRLPDASLRADGDAYAFSYKNCADGDAPARFLLYLAPWTCGQTPIEPAAALKNANTIRLAARPEALLCTTIPAGETAPIYIGALLLKAEATGKLFA